MKKKNSSQQSITVKNHYVPIWYQKRFLKDGQTQYWCLDHENHENPYIGNPKDLFQQKHLYTIDLFGKKSDVIERELFGGIDNKGFQFIDVVAVQNGWKTEKGHQGWEAFMGFMNAQKLRTPKGLDWIKKYLVSSGHHNSIENNVVMNILQQIRFLYCSMWTEAIWEIVSATDCEVKFIVSDNPVTFYNYCILPDSKEIQYPDEPSLMQTGTQTIYPLSLDKCLILTHRQMALSPDSIDPLANRINARFYDDANNRAIFSFLDIIHERYFNDSEVQTVNFILKKQSKRFVAASKKEWLYPETQIDANEWSNLCKTLLPPRNEVTVSTGIFLGHVDGSIEGFDPYGRRVKDEKELQGVKKGELIIKRHTRKEKFSFQLTDLLNKEDGPDNEQRNLLLIEGMVDIFDMQNFKDVDTFKNNFTAAKVKTLYQLIDDLWPVGTDVFKSLSKDDSFCLLYAGELDFEIVPVTIFNMGLYFDKMYITIPFASPQSVRDEFNPVLHPENYLTTTYGMMMSMLFLTPWIETKQVQLLPSPFYLDFSFRKMAMKGIATRMNSTYMVKDEKLFCRQFMKQFEQMLLMVPDELLEQSILNAIPGLPAELVAELSQLIRGKKKNAFVWSKSLESIGPQMLVNTIGEPLEAVFYLAKLINAIPYTYLSVKKEEFDGINSEVAQAIEHTIKLLLCYDGYAIKALKDFGLMERVRGILAKLKAQPNCTTTHEELKDAILESENNWKVISDVLTKNDERFLISKSVISVNTGCFKSQSVSDHLKQVYNTVDSPLNMYLSANIAL